MAQLWMSLPPTRMLVLQVSGAEKEAEGCGGPNPNLVSGVDARPCKECHPHPPGPIDELIAALREATLGPVHPRRHGT